MSKRIIGLYILAGLQLAANLFCVFMALLFSATSFETGFWRGVQDGFCRWLGIDDVRQFGAEEFGFVLGSVFFPILLLALTIYGIRVRQRKLTIGAYLLLLLMNLGGAGSALLPFLALFLLFLPRSSRAWEQAEAVDVS